MANCSKVYSVNVNGEPVFTGSYRTADIVWRSISSAFNIVAPESKPIINISFCPR